MTDRQILLAKIFLFFLNHMESKKISGYFMDKIKSFCTEQNQTDYRNFDTGITVICHAKSIVLEMVDISMVL